MLLKNKIHVDDCRRVGYNGYIVRARQTSGKVSGEGSEDMSVKCKRTHGVEFEDILGGGYKA